jgi:hypothetical protein
MDAAKPRAGKMIRVRTLRETTVGAFTFNRLH